MENGIHTRVTMGARTCLGVLTALIIVVMLEKHTASAYTRQRFDGWYNNLANPRWGSVGEDIVYRVAPAYSDMTYQPSGDRRPNARLISNQVFQGRSGLPSYRNKTTMFVFFGQLVAYELVHASDSACPVELLKVDVPDGDPDFGNASGPSMPFMRSGYNKKTGQSPNNPRKPVNDVTTWIDGNFVYGHSDVWANCLRSFTGGQLLTLNTSKDYPAFNAIGLPLDNFPTPTLHKLADPTKLWMFGDRHAHQTPGLTSLAIVWFRYHNHIAREVYKKNPDWSDEKLYRKARRTVIATLQNIIYYEWLPKLLEEAMEPYEGYKPHIHPGISALFEAAAFRFGHTMVPPGLYLRDATCRYRRFGDKRGLRLCNAYWRSQEILKEYSLEEILMGMTSQIAEREDNILVSDLRAKSFGPLHYSRHDLAVMTLMRGRDHGLPDYNTARKWLGLPVFKQWKQINPWLYHRQKEEFYKLMKTYRNMEDMDVFPAGLMEFTPAGPGPLFRNVIKDQFSRIRDGDRYWFENKLNGMYTTAEVAEIKKIKFSDVLKAVTKVRDIDVQPDVFTWLDGNPCGQPSQIVEEDLEECTPHMGFDYFSGSEIPYITAFTSLGVFPFVCILGAYLLFKAKQVVYRYRTRAARSDSLVLGVSGEESVNPHRASFTKDTASISSTSSAGPLMAWEWAGRTEPQRRVELDVEDEPPVLRLFCSDRGRTLRTLRFERMEHLTWYTNNDNRRNMVLLHIPKEYDLVLRFRAEPDRTRFQTGLTRVLEAADIEVSRHDCRERYILDRAITKTKRQALLSNFFRGVFAESCNMKQLGHMDEIGVGQARDIKECELSREEFAEALALAPDSMFVNQMFSVIDREQKGYISFRDMIYAVVVFSKGTCEDKLHLLFMMYDIDKNGTLDREEIRKMIKSLVEIAGTAPSMEEIEKLTARIFASAGIANSPSMNFNDFKKAFSEHNDLMRRVSLDLKGACAQQAKNQKRSSMSEKRSTISEKHPVTQETSVSSGSSVRLRGGKSSGVEVVSRGGMHLTVKPETYSRFGAAIKDVRHYVENHRQHIVYSFVFFFANALVFTERFYTYAVDLEHKGFRSLAGYGVSLTRGAAASISLCFSLLLLTMCRNLITNLRETVINLYVPFDSAVAFHKLVAWTGLLSVGVHVLGYCFNFYHIATQPAQFLCIFDEIHFRSDIQPNFSFWLFMNLTGVTGYLLTLVTCVMYTFATQTSRAHIFNAFWISHKLFYVFYILILLHGASRVIQNPMFAYYFIGPACLFTIDKTISLSRKKREIHIQDAELLPSHVTKVEFKRPPNFEYKSGQWIRLACVELGKNEYHPFTLTSAPHEDTLSTYIRTAGPWTSAFRNLLSNENLRDKPYPNLYLDGPYGAGQQDWYRYDVSVLVGGGIGVTPYASILKDFVFMSSVKNTFRMKCRKVYFVWVTASHRHYEWFIDILRQVEAVDHSDLVETHIFITQFFQKFDLRTTMLYICEEHFQRLANKSIFTGLHAHTHFGRPNFEDILVEVHRKHPKVRKVGVFSCGPPGLTKGVEKACHASSGRTKASFLHHFENF